MQTTKVTINDADGMLRRKFSTMETQTHLFAPNEGWAWVTVVTSGSTRSISIAGETDFEIVLRIDHLDESASTWIFRSPRRPVRLTGLDGGSIVECFVNTLPEPLANLIADGDQAQVRSMARMLGSICFDDKASRSAEILSSKIVLFNMLRGCAAVARRLGFFETEVELLSAALDIRKSSNLNRLLSYAYANAQDYPHAIKAAKIALQNRPELATGSFQLHLLELQAYRDVKSELTKIAKIPRRFNADNRKIAYCLHNARPISQGGYAMRSHALAKAVINSGRDLIAFARPGFPSDGSAPACEIAGSEMVDHVEYKFDNSFGRKKRAYGYIAEAADYFERSFVEHEIGVVHAATNFWTALPAAIAAYRLQLPFIYEVRSFWSITREADWEGFAHTPQAIRDDALEAIVLAMADQIITLNSEMRKRLVSQGVDAKRISVVPNSVDADSFSPKPSDAKLAKLHGIEQGDIVIGYMGAMLGYEGLDTLIEASAPLIRDNMRVRLMLVGADPLKKSDPSSVESMLIDQISSLGLGKQITLVDKVAPSQVRDFYDLFDICVYPRRGYEVCELVSPLKPLEAMASAKTVIVSDVKGLLDMVRDEETALVFTKENVEVLSATLKRAIYDDKLRDRLGKAAQAFVQTERSWTQAARITQETYRRAENSDGSRSKVLEELVNFNFS